MPKKSKSNRRKHKAVQKSKQEWRLKQPTRNWLELPSDITRNILQRVEVIDRIDNAQLVCTAWREIIKDPAMWRVVYMDRYTGGCGRMYCRDMCKVAVHRSQGQLVDLTTVGFCDNHLLQFVADGHVMSFGFWNELAVSIGKNLPRLNHLELVGNNMTNIGLQAILDGCRHLELLDLRRCLYIDLKGELGKRSSQQIKHLKLPDDPLDGLPYISYDLYETCDSDDDDDY
ncbi:putative F-box/LRR-repeat protein 23 [Bidens hawaiensis]|uniref:putative F-box/LRR-repeat protein 23 n=1 Tax=Bidens hawaiensis TaxID=980011 RepID=UPI0040497F4B